MAEEKPKRKPIHVRWYLRLGIVLGAALFVFLGLSKLTHWDFSLPDHVGAPDDVMGYKDSEITEMIAGENRELKQLIVYEQDIEASMDITDMFLDIDWFRKKQTVHLIATAEYIVDLSKITDKDITVDRNDRRITIVIPRAELKNVNIDYSKTTFDDIERNIFGWGDIKLTPYQTLLRYYERLQSAYGWTVQEVDETDAGILLDQLLVTALVRDKGCQKFIEDVM